MKNVFTFLMICAVSILNAQVFSEDFSDGVPGSMIETTVNGSLSWTDCGGDTGGVSCSEAATFYHTSHAAYNTALDTPVLDLSSGVYKVSYTLAKRVKNEKVNEFFVEISTDGGSTFTTMVEQPEEVADLTNFSLVITPYNPTTNTVIRFRSRNKIGYATVLDNISIDLVTSDDASVKSINIPSLIIAGDTEVKGELVNLGVNPITSFDLNWQVDGGATYTQNYTGQNISSGQTFNFTHSDLWSPTGGTHTLKVWVSNTNFTDVDSSNDEKTISVDVASGMTRKIPLYEKFSSSTCPPCYTFNFNYWNPFYSDYAHTKATFISYQVNWPGAGDPYYTNEIGARRNYYSISGAPTLLINGTTESTDFSIPQLQAKLDNILSEDRISFFNIESDHVISGNNITVTANITPYINGNYTVHVMVIEKETTENTGGNGETEFHHVMMKALPNASGTNVSFVQDQVETLSFTHDMSSTFVEEISDLAVVVFIQNNATKEILQSGYTESSGIVLGTEDTATTASIVLVPNPTSGIVKIFADRTVNLQIFDLTGKNVYNQSNIADNTTLDLSKLGKGVFVVTMADKDGNKTVKKLVIK
ncbi:MAG: T9SS type A sorting domain-containing protein [Moheibacter sp.]